MNNSKAISILTHLQDAFGEQMKQSQRNKERIGGSLMDSIATGSLITLEHLTKDYRCEVELLRCLEFCYKDLQCIRKDFEHKRHSESGVEAWFFIQLHQDVLANFANDAITAEVLRSVSALFHHVLKHYSSDL
jgi:hypothetical protein